MGGGALAQGCRSVNRGVSAHIHATKGVRMRAALLIFENRVLVVTFCESLFVYREPYGYPHFLVSAILLSVKYASSIKYPLISSSTFSSSLHRLLSTHTQMPRLLVFVPLYALLFDVIPMAFRSEGRKYCRNRLSFHFESLARLFGKMRDIKVLEMINYLLIDLSDCAFSGASH
jgi:hypothetical protein